MITAARLRRCTYLGNLSSDEDGKEGDSARAIELVPREARRSAVFEYFIGSEANQIVVRRLGGAPLCAVSYCV